MTFIYHITHLKNLRSILESGRLWCDRERLTQQLTVKGIAHEAIKQRRERRRAPTSKGGTLADYVPFYFASRSPMLCAIHNRTVTTFDEGQNLILHLFSKVEKVVQNNLPFTFTDGHAEMATSEFFENVADLDKIDAKLMQSTYWHDTEEDGDRKRRRQAEFLVHKQFPINLLNGIGVISEAVKKQVEDVLNEAGIKMIVAVKPHWYY